LSARSRSFPQTLVYGITAEAKGFNVWLNDSGELTQGALTLLGLVDDLDAENERTVTAPPTGYFAISKDPNESPDISVWFAEFAAGLIGYQHSRSLTEFPITTVAHTETGAIAATPDGNAWFT
jgi:hypothetical protein